MLDGSKTVLPSFTGFLIVLNLLVTFTDLRSFYWVFIPSFKAKTRFLPVFDGPDSVLPSFTRFLIGRSFFFTN